MQIAKNFKIYIFWFLNSKKKCIKEILLSNLPSSPLGKFFSTSIYIYIPCWSQLNAKTAEPIGPNFFATTYMTPGKVYEKLIFMDSLEIYQCLQKNPQNLEMTAWEAKFKCLNCWLQRGAKHSESLLKNF